MDPRRLLNWEGGGAGVEGTEDPTPKGFPNLECASSRARERELIPLVPLPPPPALGSFFFLPVLKRSPPPLRNEGGLVRDDSGFEGVYALGGEREGGGSKGKE